MGVGVIMVVVSRGLFATGCVDAEGVDAFGAMVSPKRSPLIGGRSFGCVARFATHPPKGIRPLPCAKSSLVVFCG